MSVRGIVLLGLGVAVVGGLYWGYQNGGLAQITGGPPLDIQTPDQAAVRGVDVSHYQGDVDFAKLMGAGMDFAYIKASEGEKTPDDLYATHRKSAEAAGILFGSYHYYVTSEGPDRQSEHFLSVIGDISGQLPPVVDVETPPTGGVTDLAADIKTFVATVKDKTGCAPIIYSNKSVWDGYLKLDTDTYPLWLAEYASELSLPASAKDWVFWQYSQTGSAPGVDGNVDTDVFNGYLQDLKARRCS